MSAIVVIGGQWGDEGKGRIVDLIAQKAHIVARYSAGNNAGHTIINELGEFKLHLVPAGIFYRDKVCIIGNGVMCDPAELLKEIADLESRGVDIKGRLFVSDRAQVLMPWHSLLDQLDEKARGKEAIGTTGRGVGPAFQDKVGRLGIRVADLADREHLAGLISFIGPKKNAAIEKIYGGQPVDLDRTLAEYSDYGKRLEPYIADTCAIVQDAVRAGETVLLEGAQGALLDLDTGTYPYVTSSVPSSVAAGAAIGIGIGPTQISTVLGVYKAYNTRVGAGPFPTEQDNEIGALLRDAGRQPEYGATTGRPRRCGWFDGVAARYTARLNGLTGAALTRLDSLDAFETINVCTAYRIGGQTVNTMPASLNDLNSAEPVYETLPGWKQDTSGVRAFKDLPKAAQEYVHFIQEILETPLCIVSVGPEREQAISLKHVI